MTEKQKDGVQDSKELVAEEISPPKFEIDVSSLAPIFQKHIDIEDNNKILFSGKFGIGKTYFLRKYFEENKDKYNIFHLYPVNYHILSNEDIVEFLKYDILVELSGTHEVAFEKNDYSSLMDFEQLLYLWGKDNVGDIVKRGISYFGKLGRPLHDIIELTQGFLEFKRRMEAGELGDVNEFIADIKKKEILEDDLISDLIKIKLNNIKGKKENVLVLDDLERIDPEHIFRILNIFSACADKNGKNKFGFDKIVLVGDYNNLKSIFYHKYGKDTDASGYFDKFFSIEVFQFDNADVIRNVVDNIISQFILEGNEHLRKAMTEGNILRFILKDIFIKAIDLSGKEKLNLRQLLKGIKFPLNGFDTKLYNNTFLHGNDKIMMQFINLSIIVLISILGGINEDLLSVLEKVRDGFTSREKNDESFFAYQTISFYLLRVVYPNAGFTEDSFKCKWNGYDLTIEDKQIIKASTQIDLGTNGSDFVKKYLYYDLLIKYIREKYYLENI